jgi:hypothetical protein
VLVFFNGIYETDVEFYAVYRSVEATTGYVEIGTVAALANPNLDLIIYEYRDNSLINGVTYWYAVTSIDYAGQESELSAENVFDTPRPDGQSSMFPKDLAPTLAGFNLATAMPLDWTSPAADIWVDRIMDVNGIDTTWFPFLNASDVMTDIQDLGYTENFDEISFAPADGWSQLGYVEALEGHTYVVWTNTDHYAKIRITSITLSGAITFQWGYQTAVGNLELAPPVRPPHDDNYPATKPSVISQWIK